MKRKLILVVVVVAAMFGALIIHRWPTPAVAGVFGSLSKEDQLQIRLALRHAMWQRLFLGPLARMPQHLGDVATGRIQEILFLPQQRMQLRVTSYTGYNYYLIEKSTERGGLLAWRVLGRSVAPFGVRVSSQGPASFGTNAFSSQPNIDSAAANAAMTNLANGARVDVWELLDEASGRAPSTKRPFVISQEQFATSLSNRASLSFGR